jgi:hypothetical protein
VKVPRLDPYWAGSLACVLAAVLLIALALLTDRGNLTTASLILAAVVCIVTSILLVILSRGDPVDPRIAGLLPVQGCINLCRFSADLGLKGNSFFIPGMRGSRGSTMQFIPVTTFSPPLATEETFVAEEDANGILSFPSGAPLIAWLREQAKLVLPGNVEEWAVLAREIGEEVLGIADTVTGGRSGDCVTLTMKGYRFMDGCDAMRRESPKCCTMNPCPVCSMYACLLAESLGQVVEVRSCTPSPDRRTVTMILCPVTGGTP